MYHERTRGERIAVQLVCLEFPRSATRRRRPDRGGNEIDEIKPPKSTKEDRDLP